MITPMLVPPTAPMPMIGAKAFVMMASGMLSSRPKNRPTAQPGHGNRAAPMTNPIPKRATKAAVMAALLSGKLIGSMIPMSMAPNTNPQMTPRLILDMSTLRATADFQRLVNQLIRAVSRHDLRFPRPSLGTPRALQDVVARPFS